MAWGRSDWSVPGLGGHPGHGGRGGGAIGHWLVLARRVVRPRGFGRVKGAPIGSASARGDRGVHALAEIDE